MKTFIGVVVALVLIVGGIVFSTNKQEHNEVVKIGVIAPLSERGATWGENVRDSFLLAHGELSTSDQARFELIFEDDQLDAAKAVSAYRKLKDIDGIDAVVTVGAGSSLAVAPLAEAEGVLMFALTNDPAVTADKTHVFKHFFLPSVDAQIMAEEIELRGYKKVGIFVTEYPGVLVIKDELQKILPEDVEVVEMKFESSVKDFRTQIAKMNTEDVDAIGLFMMPGQIGLMAKQVRESGMTQPLFSVGTVDDANELATGGVALEGAWVSGPEGPLPWFNDRFKETYGRDAGLFTGNAYDVATILFELFETTRDQSVVAEKASEITGFSGAMGDDMIVDETNSMVIGAVIREIKDGKLQFVHD